MGNVANDPQPGVPNEGDGGVSNIGHTREIPAAGAGAPADGVDVIDGPANGPDEIQR